jgi:4-nitrophenyl phosphatase
MLPDHIKALILDMDGVLWRSDAPIGDLASMFNQLYERGIKYAFATNNSTTTPEKYVEKLAGFGVEAVPAQVITSSMAVAELVAQRFPSGTKIFMVGGDGIRAALLNKGFELLPVENPADAKAVVIGLDRQITFNKVVEAALLIRSGVPFYGTNADRTFPTSRGEIPGGGAWLSVYSVGTGVEPIVAGKPSPYMMELALKWLGTKKEETLVIGDRLETDIASGQAIGCPTAAVLSGVSTREQAEAWTPRIDFIANDLESLVNS